MTARTTRVEVAQEGDHIVAREVPLTSAELTEAAAIHEQAEAQRAMAVRRAEERTRAAAALAEVAAEVRFRRPVLGHLVPGLDTPQPVHRVALVACGATKLQETAPAADLYIGRMFKAARAYAELTCDAWFILSALHFLVDPRRELEPYNYSFQALDAESRRHKVRVMSTSIVNLLAHLGDGGPLGEGIELVVLAGNHYREAVEQATARPAFAGTVSYPLKGLGIGDQYAWIKAQLSGDQLALDFEETPA